MFIFPNLVFFQLVAVSMMLTEFLSTSFGLGILFAIMGLCVWTYAVPKYNTVYAVGFTVFSGLPEWSTDIAYVLDSHRKHLKPEDVDFLAKILKTNGVGNDTQLPGNLRKLDSNEPIQTSIAFARKEAEIVMFDVLLQLFEQYKIDPTAIDILVVNCSLFNPTPSLTSMIVNRFKMRHDIHTYNLSGMGCSAGLIAVQLVKDLLSSPDHRNQLAVIVSTENITQNMYQGCNRSMLISNSLFRVGAAAVLMSNRPQDRKRAKYMLEHTVRTHMGADDASYKCVFQDIDEQGHPGVRLERSVMDVAAKALTKNISLLAHKILPWHEKLRYFWNVYYKKIPKKQAIPNFKTVIDHFCIHTGGRAVIDRVQESLSLTDQDVLPSRTILQKNGNTSSSSIWYELKFIQESGRLRRNQRIWMIAFGSGFKCNSIILKCLQ